MIQKEEIDFSFHFLKCIRKRSRSRIDNIIDALWEALIESIRPLGFGAVWLW